MLTLTRQSNSSYRVAVPAELTTWLVGQNYRVEDARSPYEYMRLRRGQSLIVVYHSGSVVLQGGDVESPRELFRSLMPAPVETESLPF